MGRGRIGRRTFLAGAAAAACAGCVGGGSGDRDEGARGGGAGTAATGDAVVTNGFGGVVEAGKLVEVLDRIDRGRGFLYVPQARFYLTRFPAAGVDAAVAVYDERLHEGIRAGVVATYQKCPHLGCRVPPCETSGWFECPCHSSRFTGIGELVDGVSPRGMDHFPVSIDGEGVVHVDTSVPVDGVPIGTETVPHDSAGPHCVSG